MIVTPEMMEKMKEGPGITPHSHPFHELFCYFGTNTDDPSDLGGEIEFWLEDEQYILTKSCIIFVPKGMKHCPLITRRVDRPIFHLGGSI